MAHSVYINVRDIVNTADSSSTSRNRILRAVDLCVAEILITTVRLVIGTCAQWRECAPSDRLRIYYANHTSHLDCLLLWSALPEALRRKTRPVAAREYWQQNRFRRYFAERVFQCVFIDRERSEPWLNPVGPLLDALDRGESLILFPEGTRGNGVTLQSFRAGIFRTVSECPGVELVPVWLDNAHRVMPKGSLLPLPILCTATFGRPTRLEHEETKPQFLQRIRQHLLNVGKHDIAA